MMRLPGGGREAVWEEEPEAQTKNKDGEQLEYAGRGATWNTYVFLNVQNALRGEKHLIAPARNSTETAQKCTLPYCFRLMLLMSFLFLS